MAALEGERTLEDARAVARLAGIDERLALDREARHGVDAGVASLAELGDALARQRQRVGMPPGRRVRRGERIFVDREVDLLDPQLLDQVDARFGELDRARGVAFGERDSR